MNTATETILKMYAFEWLWVYFSSYKNKWVSCFLILRPWGNVQLLTYTREHLIMTGKVMYWNYWNIYDILAMLGCYIRNFSQCKLNVFKEQDHILYCFFPLFDQRKCFYYLLSHKMNKLFAFVSNAKFSGFFFFVLFCYLFFYFFC